MMERSLGQLAEERPRAGRAVRLGFGRAVDQPRGRRARGGVGTALEDDLRPVAAAGRLARRAVGVLERAVVRRRGAERPRPRAVGRERVARHALRSLLVVRQQVPAAR